MRQSTGRDDLCQRDFSSRQTGLDYIEVWVDDTTSHIFHSGESAQDTGIRLRLWLAAAKGAVSPVGTLPDDDDLLARLAMVSNDVWMEAKNRITNGWKRRQSRWHLRRIEEQHERRKARQERARQSAKARWNRDLAECERNANALPEHMHSDMRSQCSPSPSPSPSPTEEKSKTKEKKKSSPPAAAGDAFDRAWGKVPRHGLAKDQARQEWSRFLIFWAVYPRKEGKLEAFGAWLKHRPPTEPLLAVIEAKNGTRQWRDVSFIPHPATFLNAGSWEDEVVQPVSALDKVAERIGGGNGDQR